MTCLDLPLSAPRPCGAQPASGALFGLGAAVLLLARRLAAKKECG